MHKTLRRLPSLDFLAASKPPAGSCPSRGGGGDCSSRNRHCRARCRRSKTRSRRAAVRAQASCARADAGRRRVSSRRHRRAAGARDGGGRRARRESREPGLTVSTTVSFASLWVIPRLASSARAHPEVEVYVSADDRLIDLGRGEVDVAVRYLADASAPDGAVRLFGERMMPVVEPEARAPPRNAACAARRSRAARAAASRRSRRPHAVARLERVARMRTGSRA